MGIRVDWGINRPCVDEYFLAMARLVSSRGTCIRRQTGCVLVNRYRHVIGTGYNGRPMGAHHCIDKPCRGAYNKSGQGLDQCEAIHAEQNALLQCRNTMEITTAYCTHSPCIHCVKLLQNTSCQTIIFLEPYAHDDISRELWERSPMNGRIWLHYKNDQRNS